MIKGIEKLTKEQKDHMERVNKLSYRLCRFGLQGRYENYRSMDWWK